MAERGPAPSNQLLTVAEAAVYANVSERMIRRLTGSRHLPFHKLGRHVRIRVSDLDRYIDAGRVGASHPDARHLFPNDR